MLSPSVMYSAHVAKLNKRSWQAQPPGVAPAAQGQRCFHHENRHGHAAMMELGGWLAGVLHPRSDALHGDDPAKGLMPQMAGVGAPQQACP